MKREPLPWLKPGVFIGALVPLAWTAMRAWLGLLGADPVAQIENELGLTALVLLLASLASTPLRRVAGWSWPVRIRRELGLFAFFYVCLHVLMYALIDQGLNVWIIIEDVLKRPFITVGFLALVLLIPLAWTSSPESVRQLGFKKWQRLHALVYVAGILAVIHFIWRVKVDVTQPITYASVLGILLLIRVAFWLRQRQRTRTGPAAASR
jgi:methionine sulfoxide reductase heme-binding subunit